jgi:hypothetical protein
MAADAEVKPDAKEPFVDPTPIPGVIFALPKDDIVIDGVVDEWQKLSFVEISAPTDYVQTGATGAGIDSADISAMLAARWSATHLYLAVIVSDGNYQNDATGELFWQGDSMQAAFDVAGNGGTAYDTTDDFEYGWARAVGDALESYRWQAPGNQPGYVAAGYSVIRNGATTVYETSLSASDLGLTSFTATTPDIGFSWLVNDADGSGREGYVEWSSGIGLTKNPGLFGILRFHPIGP